jgi:hypothetical protein
VLAGSTTLVDVGTILGNSGPAISVAGGTDRIMLRPGGVIEGAIVASGTRTKATLELAVGTGRLTAPVTHFSSLVPDRFAHWTLAAAGAKPAPRSTLDPQAVLTIDGVLQAMSLNFLSGSDGETLRLGTVGAIATEFRGFNSGLDTIDLLGVVRCGTPNLDRTLLDRPRQPRQCMPLVRPRLMVSGATARCSRPYRCRRPNGSS